MSSTRQTLRETDELIARLSKHDKVSNVLILSRMGSIIESTFEEESSKVYAKLAMDVLNSASMLFNQVHSEVRAHGLSPFKGSGADAVYRKFLNSYESGARRTSFS